MDDRDGWRDRVREVCADDDDDDDDDDLFITIFKRVFQPICLHTIKQF